MSVVELAEQKVILPNNEPAPNVFLMGPIGSGKSYAIRSLVNAGIEVFLIPTEPGYTDVLGDIPPEKLHWHYIRSYGPPPDQGQQTSKTLDALKGAAKLIQSHDMETIKKMPGQGRAKYNQFFELIECLNNYKDDRTGKEYGDTGNFNQNQAVVIDGLSGINNMVCRMTVGDKPCMSWPEFEAAQFCVEQFVNTLAQSLKCWFVMTSHVEFEPDPSGSGLNKLMPSTIGKVLAPRLTKFFSEAILCKRVIENGKSRFYWDNMDPTATVKFRNIPQSPTNPPDFAPIKKNWEGKVSFN